MAARVAVDRRRDAAAVIALARHPGGELRCPVTGEDQMGVGVDEARDDRPAAQVLAASSAAGASAARPTQLINPVLDDDRSTVDDPQRIRRSVGSLVTSSPIPVTSVALIGRFAEVTARSQSGAIAAPSRAPDVTEAVPPRLDDDLAADDHGVDVRRSSSEQHLARRAAGGADGVEPDRDKVGHGARFQTGRHPASRGWRGR